MNRVLSLPNITIFPGFFDAVKNERRMTEVTEEGTVKFDHYLGQIEMKFSMPAHQLEPGTKVYVWWKGGGFVCAPIQEMKAEKSKLKRIEERVTQARSQLAAARKARSLLSSGVSKAEASGSIEAQDSQFLITGVTSSQFNASLLNV